MRKARRSNRSDVLVRWPLGRADEARSRRREAVFAAALLALAASGGLARAQGTDPPRKYAVVTTLPTFTTPPPRFLASDDPRLLAHALGLDYLRNFHLSPRVELSVDPSASVPSKLMKREMERACEDATLGIRRRAEGG